MRIVQSAERGETNWTARKLVQMVKNGEANFNIDIQRGYVWKNSDRKSAFIRSLILDRKVPPLYFNKVNDIYEGEDGKQRAYTLIKFMEDGFELTGLPDFTVVDDDGECEEVDINGLKYSQLPECFQEAIKDYNFMICYTDGADQEEQAETFYNLNNGQALNAATMNRVKAKSKTEIIRMGKHKLFTEALSETAMEGHVNEDLIVKAHAVLYAEEPMMDTKWIRPYTREVEIESYQEMTISNVLDRIYEIHNRIEDKKIAKRLYVKTHLISIVPMVARSLDENMSEEKVMNWLVGFYSGKKSASVSSIYNSAAGSGSGKREAVRKRLDELKHSYETYFAEELKKAS